ncbi:MAG TPA: PD-(D/E)XK nuclease family protein [Candidatus Pacearchaeota archaeon]|nr:PD-(D/E)XK nuclease family protein [Candidatus Parcubacteria bacterium]HNZ83855.1 PD-(D/E)XK nuclease family protein [Candidatus Pacearchaeota archaeon]HOU45537.1 PD-(D/E)XK nuclease family protein [Candidatus Pacearchaeota archaeon]HPM08582.1 PD-(D/E)XK nuclease family protein [Candidatus Pacearchaeota archaeon]HQI74305.1 PD-(D/E)XK nuclease family protein [Candidatus Pacearchaeota archaeon]
MSYSSYNPPKPEKYLFNPKSKAPFRFSRSKIDLFMECPRCFYLDRRLGIDRPPSFPFNLNKAVDELLKREFDIHRSNKTPHELMKKFGIDAVPFDHKKIDEWRDTFKGVSYFHESTGFEVFGGVDDIWVNKKDELIVVDYKATSKKSEVNLDAEWQNGYKRQVEVYQWLLRKNGFKVSDTAYFVYCNGDSDKEAFDGKLEFDVKIIPYKGDDSWIDEALIQARKCLEQNKLPESGHNCDYCKYIKALGQVKQKYSKN